MYNINNIISLASYTTGMAAQYCTQEPCGCNNVFWLFGFRIGSVILKQDMQ